MSSISECYYKEPGEECSEIPNTGLYLDLVSSSVDTLYTFGGVILPTIKLKVYTFWGLPGSEPDASKGTLAD